LYSVALKRNEAVDGDGDGLGDGEGLGLGLGLGLGEGLGLGLGDGEGKGLGEGEAAGQAAVAEPQGPTVNCVPPRVPSRRRSLEAPKVEPRRPARTEPLVMAGPFVTNALSLLTETLTVMVCVATSMQPLSAAPLSV
jgi:hypothetical protein